MKCSPGWEQGRRPLVALCHAKVCRESKPTPKPQASPRIEGQMNRTELFLGGCAGACPQPVPADLGAGPGVGSQQTHPLPFALQKTVVHRQLRGYKGPGTTDVSGFSPNGDRFSVCQSHLDINGSPGAPNPPENYTEVWEADRVHLAEFLRGQRGEPPNGSGSYEVWVVRGPWGQECFPNPAAPLSPWA